MSTGLIALLTKYSNWTPAGIGGLAIPFAILLILAAALSIAGCNPAQREQAQQYVQQAKEAAEAAQEAVVQAQAARDAIAAEVSNLPDEEDRALWEDRMRAAEKALLAAQVRSEQAVQVLAEMNQTLGEADNLGDVIAGGAQAVAPVIPPPYGVLVGALGGLIGGLWRARHNRVAGRNLAGALESVKEGPTINLGANKDKISAMMGASGKRLVDEAQGKRWGLPF